MNLSDVFKKYRRLLTATAFSVASMTAVADHIDEQGRIHVRFTEGQTIITVPLTSTDPLCPNKPAGDNCGQVLPIGGSSGTEALVARSVTTNGTTATITLNGKLPKDALLYRVDEDGSGHYTKIPLAHLTFP